MSEINISKIKSIITYYDDDSWKNFEFFYNRLKDFLDKDMDTLFFEPVDQHPNVRLKDGGTIKVYKQKKNFFSIKPGHKRFKIYFILRTFKKRNEKITQIPFELNDPWNQFKFKSSSLLESYTTYITEKTTYNQIVGIIKCLKQKFDSIKIPYAEKKVLILVFGRVANIEKVKKRLNSKESIDDISIKFISSALIRLLNLGRLKNLIEKEELIFDNNLKVFRRELSSFMLNSTIRLKKINDPIFQIVKGEKNKFLRLTIDFSNDKSVSTDDVRKFKDQLIRIFKKHPFNLDSIGGVLREKNIHKKPTKK